MPEHPAMRSNESKSEEATIPSIDILINPNKKKQREMIVRRKQPKPKGWFESFLDDTNIIEKLFFLIWFGVIGIFYVMKTL